MAEDINNAEQTSASSGSANGASSSPVGSGNYEVQQGDCIESIAFNHGHFWKTVWNHPDNQQLKSVRKDPNVLLAGDKVFVPDLRPKQESGATEQRHRFKRKGVPSAISIVLKEKGKPRANVQYVLEIDGVVTSGTTDGEGRIQHSISPHARTGSLTVGENKEEFYTLRLGHVDPIDEVTGYQARLKNLGYYHGPIDGESGEETAAALRRFQRAQGLRVTGQADSETRDKLKSEYGC
jgi:N-acetylmuramoyl-L-alanine amidase